MTQIKAFGGWYVMHFYAHYWRCIAGVVAVSLLGFSALSAHLGWDTLGHLIWRCCAEMM